MVCLIKPQFEAGREKVGKKGVVRDRAVHEEVIENVTEMTAGLGFAILGLAYSPIRGPEGNIEYLMYIEKPGEEGPTGGIEPGALQETIRRLVDDSHRELDR
jgi:23S rRNA (cytidine1920-2'-O)/16S rRNA (cytidine1409-2'-O)-methyltransferase